MNTSGRRYISHYSDGFHESTFRSVDKFVFDVMIVLFLLPNALHLMILVVAIFIESLGRGGFIVRHELNETVNLSPFISSVALVVDAEKDEVAGGLQEMICESLVLVQC